MSNGESPSTIKKPVPLWEALGEAGRMQTQVCPIWRKDESSCIAAGPAEAIQKLLSLASSAAPQLLMGLRVAEGSWWI